MADAPIKGYEELLKHVEDADHVIWLWRVRKTSLRSRSGFPGGLRPSVQLVFYCVNITEHAWKYATEHGTTEQDAL